MIELVTFCEGFGYIYNENIIHKMNHFNHEQTP